MFIIKTFVALASLVAVLTTNAVNSEPLGWTNRVANIKQTMLLPAVTKANSAVKLAVEDPKQACSEAGSAEGLMKRASLDAHELLREMTTAGEDDQTTHRLVDDIDAGAQNFVQLREAVCSGQLAKTETSPATQKFAQLLGVPMKEYTDDVMEANAAANRSDESGRCLALRKGQSVLSTLRINLAILRTTAEADGSEEALNLCGSASKVRSQANLIAG